MKDLKEFSFFEWLTLQPLKTILKQIRNDIWLFFYCSRAGVSEDQFLRKNAQYRGQRILLVIAFEQPKVLEWLFELSKKNLKNFQIMVFDNSRTDDFRRLTQRVCDQYQIPYIALPKNRTRHPNRSHGMAVTWVYRRIVKKIQPSWFGFLDHDMIPIREVNFDMLTNDKICYGVINEKPYYWTLWAGYCFYQYEKVKNLPLNFLYDFSRNLDTGGRNWRCLYEPLDKAKLQLAYRSNVHVEIDANHQFLVQLMDTDWLHIGGVSYNNTFGVREKFYQKLVDELNSGREFSSMIKDMKV